MTHVSAALLTLPDGRFVMQRRGSNVAFAPLKLGFFGAKVEAGETPEAAVLRALKEKTTMDVAGLVPELVHEIDITHEDVHMLVFKIPVPNADFLATSGHAQVHTLHDLRSRIDLTPSLQQLVAVL
jgi:8-oxo-dGTP pyrophosphatase MutT (NUDIX family)